MKMNRVVALTMGFAMSTTFAATNAVPLSSTVDKISYSIGVDLGKNIKNQGIEMSPAVLAQGIQDGMNGAALRLTEQEMKDVLSTFQKELMAKRTAQFDK